MTALLNWRIWAAVGLAALLAVTHGFAYKTGRALVRSEWDKDVAARTVQALAAEQAARAKERELQTKVRKVANDYQTEKTRRAADAAVNAGRLSELQAALNSAPSGDTTPSGGADDPRGAIINQCASALIGLDDYAKSVAGKARALQDYTREVCMK